MNESVKIKSYSSIENLQNARLGVKELNDLFKGGWTAQLKLDGTNVALGYIDNDLAMRGRKKWYIHPNTESIIDPIDCDIKYDGYGFVPYVHQTFDLELLKTLHQQIGDFLIFGEFYGGNIQKRAKMGNKKFAAFDMYVNNRWLTPEEMAEIVSCMGIPVIPVVVSDSREWNASELDAYLDEIITCDISRFDSTWAGDNEGVVIKPLAVDEIRNYRGVRQFYKWKNPNFKETGNKLESKKKKFPDPIAIASYTTAQHYLTEGRFLTNIPKMGAEGIDPFNTKFRGKTIQFIADDIRDEVFADYTAGKFPEDVTMKTVMRHVGTITNDMLNSIRQKYGY